MIIAAVLLGPLARVAGAQEDDPDPYPVAPTTVAVLGDGEVAAFSNTGADLDVLAPGSPITTTVLNSYDPSGFAAQRGTPFSAPHVAAAFALVDSSLPNGWPVGRVRNLLRVSGAMIERPMPSPFDRDPRYPELRLASLTDFEPFADADHGFWVEAADWAKATGVSTGIGGNLFDPDSALSRAQAVTFLWWFMGSPDAGTDSSFSDVDPDQSYSAAVTWPRRWASPPASLRGRSPPMRP